MKHPVRPPSVAPAPAQPSQPPPVLSEYKGHKLIVLNPAERFPVQFGLGKARLVVEHIEAIRRFVESGGVAV